MKQVAENAEGDEAITEETLPEETEVKAATATEGDVEVTTSEVEAADGRSCY